MLLLLPVVLLTVALAPLEECRAKRDAFDVDASIAACGAAADDARLDVASRIFALRLLAGAHLLKKDAHAAEMVLVRMLAFDGDAAPAADDGPEFRRLLESARARVLDDAALDVRVVREGERAIAVRVIDRHGRVARAELVDKDKSTPLARLDEAPGVSSFALPEDANEDAIVVVTGWTNKVLRREHIKAEPMKPLATSVRDLPPEGIDTLGWTLVATGAALAVTGATFWTATVYDLNVREACSADPSNGCVPNKPFLFGIYSVENRATFFEHQQAWLLGSSAAIGAGALIAIAGVGLVTYE